MQEETETNVIDPQKKARLDNGANGYSAADEQDLQSIKVSFKPVERESVYTGRLDLPKDIAGGQAKPRRQIIVPISQDILLGREPNTDGASKEEIQTAYNLARENKIRMAKSFVELTSTIEPEAIDGNVPVWADTIQVLFAPNTVGDDEKLKKIWGVSNKYDFARKVMRAFNNAAIPVNTVLKRMREAYKEKGDSLKSEQAQLKIYEEWRKSNNLSEEWKADSSDSARRKLEQYKNNIEAVNNFVAAVAGSEKNLINGLKLALLPEGHKRDKFSQELVCDSVEDYNSALAVANLFKKCRDGGFSAVVSDVIQQVGKKAWESNNEFWKFVVDSAWQLSPDNRIIKLREDSAKDIAAFVLEYTGRRDGNYGKNNISDANLSNDEIQNCGLHIIDILPTNI